MLRFEFEGPPELSVEEAELAIVPGCLLISEGPSADAAANVKLGAFQLQYRFERFSTGLADLRVLWIAATQRLFLGGKYQSCVVNVATPRVEHVFEHFLFWSFSTARAGFVLETGELACLLRRDDGEIVATTAVDPPWEMHPEADGYRFESLVVGTTFLRYPPA